MCCDFHFEKVKVYLIYDFLCNVFVWNFQASKNLKMKVSALEKCAELEQENAMKLLNLQLEYIKKNGIPGKVLVCDRISFKSH